MTAANITPLPEQRSLTTTLATQYGMEAKAFELTIRNACGLSDATREDFAAFLLACHQHGLNPVTREIYAMKRKNEPGYVPVVSVDGWAKLINENSDFDGVTFRTEEDLNGNLKSVSCSMFRKSRSHPTEITEFFAECKRDTKQWREMPRRMLRHKALIQCARYAFGFAGVFDEDEAERFAEQAPTVTTSRALTPLEPVEDAVIIEPAEANASPQASTSATAGAEPAEGDGEDSASAPSPEPQSAFETFEDLYAHIQNLLSLTETQAHVDEVRDELASEIDQLNLGRRERVRDLFEQREEQLREKAPRTKQSTINGSPAPYKPVWPLDNDVFDPASYHTMMDDQSIIAMWDAAADLVDSREKCDQLYQVWIATKERRKKIPEANKIATVKKVQGIFMKYDDK